MSGIIGGDDRYVDRMVIDGQSYFEIGIKDPDGEGYLIERIPFDQQSDHHEIEEAIRKAKEKLEGRREKLEGQEDEFEEWDTLAREIEETW